MSCDYFEGWYYKHQALNRTLAVIPGRARDGAFIQAITDERSYNIPYPLSQYNRKKDRFKRDWLCIGNSVFTPEGICLDVQSSELTLCGELRYKNLTPIGGDIMGPFSLFPMECRHGVISMGHSLYGSVKLNGEAIDFTGGTGYIETDSGRSFPKSYSWIHANDFGRDCSIMASVAEIPFMGTHFRGCICVVRLSGREYRLATYNGAKILRCKPAAISLRKGRYQLDIHIDRKKGQALNAPLSGTMSRTIKETAACPARFRFLDGNSLLFQGKSERASYEYAKL